MYLLEKINKQHSLYREELQADSLKKNKNEDDPMVREKSLNKKLETMTNLAQILDKDHRKLKN